MITQDTINVEQFSKDHWSTLVFVETRCVDNKGILDKDRMRCNMNRHAALRGQQRSSNHKWDGEKLGTILSDGTVLSEHDDWDCLIDMAKVGFVAIIDIDLGIVSLTDRGWKFAHQLRRFIAEGGKYRDFRGKE